MLSNQTQNLSGILNTVGIPRPTYKSPENRYIRLFLNLELNSQDIPNIFLFIGCILLLARSKHMSFAQRSKKSRLNTECSYFRSGQIQDDTCINYQTETDFNHTPSHRHHPSLHILLSIHIERSRFEKLKTLDNLAA